jgi:hypothetical protein
MAELRLEQGICQICLEKLEDFDFVVFQLERFIGDRHDDPFYLNPVHVKCMLKEELDR